MPVDPLRLKLVHRELERRIEEMYETLDQMSFALSDLLQRIEED